MAEEFAKEMGVNPSQGQVDLASRGPAASTPPEASQEAPQAPTAPQAPEVAGADGNSRAILEGLLAKTKGKSDWVEVKLPSRGKAYVSAPEMVRIRPFRFEEEKALRSVASSESGISVIAKVLAACIEGINYQDLTLVDKNFLLYHIRRLSYGDNYRISSTCTSCGEENNLTLKISEIPVNYVDDDYTEPFTVTLPDSEQDIVYVSPRVVHEMQFSTPDGIMENLNAIVASVGGVSDPYIVKQFLQQTTVRDISFLVRKVFEADYGLEQRINYSCAHCNAKVEGEIGLNQDFFSPS